MKLIVTAAAVAAATLAAAPAAAADISGPRVEALVGYESATLDDFGSRDDVSESGAVYGVAAGYDIALGGTVSIGVDVEATDNNVSWREVSTTFGTDLRIDLGRDLYAGTRLTLAMSDNASVYLKGGYTNVRTRLDFTSPTFSETIVANEGGARVGAGVQIGLGGNLYASAEYRYSRYEDGDLRRHQGVGGLGLRF